MLITFLFLSSFIELRRSLFKPLGAAYSFRMRESAVID